jgi:glycosyltransferase involved in cell wall biosynthesis
MTAHTSPSRVRVLVASAGNEFMIEIAEMLSDGFVSLAVSCSVEIDQLPSPAESDVLQLVVAPHEFFPLFVTAICPPPVDEQLAAHVFVLNVEQPGSSWFELAWKYARVSRGVLDISLDGVREHALRGRRATHVPLGYTEALRPPSTNIHRQDAPVRPIDVLFLGHQSPRRDEFFARHAAFFASHRCQLVLADSSVPRTSRTPGYAAGGARRALLQASRILLNVHSTDRTYFESHRAMLALANECLFVSEASRTSAPLVAGQHFVSAALDDLPELCARYLSDEPGRQAVARRGFEFVTQELTSATSARAAMAAWRLSLEQATLAVDAKPAEDDEAIARTAVRGRLNDARHHRAAGREDWTSVVNAAYAHASSPAVTVAITLFNYSTYIGECLSSVLAAESVAGGIEVVIVDDGSTDDGPDRAVALATSTDTPVVVLRKHSNTGLADARNLAFAHARAPYVFVLDADNWIYPSALRQLHDAAATHRYDAVYGLIRRFDDATGEPLGLLSAAEWDPRALVARPYIDAMAMFDRQTVLDLGGYSTELIEHGWFGWEDYDLWLKLAEADRRCARLPNIVAAYRVHPSSMIHRTNRTTVNIVGHFHSKFAALVTRYADLDHYFGFPVLQTLAVDAHEPVEGTQQLSVAAASIGLMQHNAELERQLAELHASMSWRVTAPLRWAFRQLTGRPH